MRLLWIVVMLGCGRIGFDPPGATDARGDGTAPGDGLVGGTGETCASARAIAIGETLADQSIANADDDHANGCSNGPDVVYVFTQPAMVARTIKITAAFTGAAALASTCPNASTTCADFTPTTPLDAQMNFLAGTAYIVVDKTGGSGTTFTISVE